MSYIHSLWRQGDSLRLILFNIVMYQTIQKVHLGHGYKMTDSDLQILCQAHEAALIVENEDDLQRLTYILYI